MLKKVILINGPKRSGKNTGASLIADALPGTQVLGYSWHLKRIAHSIVYGAAGWEMDPDCMDAIKDVPQAILGGRTWRWFYIDVSEQFCKPRFGEEFFGDKFCEAARVDPSPRVVVPDSGFVGEALRTVREFGPSRVLLIRLRRKGCTFAGDSRSYIHLREHGVEEVEIENFDGRQHEYRADLLCAIRRFEGCLVDHQ